ncbi:MAG: Coenzyme F420 hydrogenase/dehydrogenase, beta subunit C-terminal domain [Lachnospiraceae bacterium]|nr:Coenzyme F420 hydrogenase/dehydrogenase, beta subunit C-terminal domain [Lachnospiraceae bacterium]
MSTSREELINRCGSQYAISHPLEVLTRLNKESRYAFIGKPCDVVALKNFMKLEAEWKGVIIYIYTLSFFCAGLPSKIAQEKLLDHLKCRKEDLQSLRYCGDGWRGYTTAVEYSGKEHKTDYATSWGSILGRDIMKMCRLCLDGIGEMADIACGDAWHLSDDKKPDFNEADGRNIIFARTSMGLKLLERVIADGRIRVGKADIDNLKYIQPYQWDRRATMGDKIFVLRCLMRTTPRYKWKDIIKYYSGVKVRRHLSIIKGTAVRIIKRRM